MKTAFVLLAFTFLSAFLMGQSTGIGIGTSTPDSSAQLDVTSINKGFLLPRMSSLQRKAIVQPATGLMVFDIDKNSLYLYNGNIWAPIGFIVEQDILPLSKEVSGGHINDHLGYAVAISGNYAIVGAPFDSTGGGLTKGAAYIFVKDSKGWNQQVKLTASDAASNQYFGFSVAIHGDYAVVGTSNQSSTGAAYVFFRNGDSWSQQAKLMASDGEASDKFGNAVTIYNDCVVVGAPYNDVNTNPDQGSSYIFVRNGTAWAQQLQLIANDGDDNNRYGMSVSLSGNFLLIGAPVNSSTGDPMGGEGSVYTYLRNGNNWTAQTKLNELSLNEGVVAFGKLVSVSGNYAAVGSYERVSVYRHDGTGWVFQKHIRPEYYSGFARSLSIAGDHIVVGSVIPLPPGLDKEGEVFCYKRNGIEWSMVKYINKIDPVHTNYTLGMAVSIDAVSLDLLIGASGGITGGEIYNTSSDKGHIYFTNLQ